MHFYEWTSLILYAAFGVLGWMRALPFRRRAIVTAIAFMGTGAIVNMRSTGIRDWLPLGFIPLAYWRHISICSDASAESD